MKNTLILLFIVLFTSLAACHQPATKTQSEPQVSTGIASTGPDALIYKTRADYYQKVPVIMNAEKTDIVSYPAPGDLRYRGKPALPVILAEGYLLDRRGISENVAFLDITYEDYMALEKTPQKEELLQNILDKDPLSEMYNCGKQSLYQDLEKELNALIIEKKLDNFVKVK